MSENTTEPTYTEQALAECRRIIQMQVDYGLDDFASHLGHQSMKKHEAELLAEIEREKASR